ncbi:MAG: glycosyltransferase family 2 protein [Mesorhizobium sp.]|nr:glycosyltransferase family A protein [Mesorhizobium sp.]MBL8579966.1 glycosyltransferase family 2 protein [Mesorhizobium sp.]
MIYMILKRLFNFGRKTHNRVVSTVSSSGATILKQLSPQSEAALPSECVTFGVTLASSRTVQDWALTCNLLKSTLKSVLRQSDPRLRVIICGHEMPDLAELRDERVEFMSLQGPPPYQPTKFRTDKFRKRLNVGKRLHQLGGGYYMQLDADDIVHRDLVDYVLRERHPNGHLIPKGYACDWTAGLVAPVPGVWRLSLERVCGSTSVLWFNRPDLPSSKTTSEQLLFNMCSQHNSIPIAFEEELRYLEIMDLPAVIYTMNHSQNLSFSLQRSGSRKGNIVNLIREQAIRDETTLKSIDENFGTSFAERKQIYEAALRA